MPDRLKGMFQASQAAVAIAITSDLPISAHSVRLVLNPLMEGAHSVSWYRSVLEEAVEKKLLRHAENNGPFTLYERAPAGHGTNVYRRQTLWGMVWMFYREMRTAGALFRYESRY
jgi:hypothetical protein